MQNPIGEADLEWILHRNCEDTEQLQVQKKTSDCEAGISFSCMFQRTKVSAKQKEKLCKSDFVSLTGAKEKTSKG